MFKLKSKKESDPIGVLIGKNTVFKGEMISEGLVRIEGKAIGVVNSTSDVIIGHEAKTILDVKANNIVIAGYIKGTLDIDQKVEIASTGTVIGVIKASELSVEDGAVFSGSCEMEVKDQEDVEKEITDKFETPEPFNEHNIRGGEVLSMSKPGSDNDKESNEDNSDSDDYKPYEISRKV